MSKSIAKVIRQALPQILSKQLPHQIVVAEVSVEKSHALNRRYRKINKPANVLSFCYGPNYGEILVCPEVIRREAKKQGNSFKYQMTWMILHGMLHLAGIHHESSKKAAEMAEKLEYSLLGKMAGKKAQSTKSKAQIKLQSTKHRVR